MTRKLQGKEPKINNTIRIEPKIKERLINEIGGPQKFFDIALALYLGGSNFIRGSFLSKFKKSKKE